MPTVVKDYEVRLLCPHPVRGRDEVCILQVEDATVEFEGSWAIFRDRQGHIVEAYSAERVVELFERAHSRNRQEAA